MMLSKRLQKLIAPMVRNLRIIWLAFAFACPLYLLLAFQLQGGRRPGPEEGTTLTVLPFLMIAAAVGAWALSLFIPRRSLSETSLRNVMATGRMPTAVELGADGATFTERVDELERGERQRLAIVPVYVQVQVVTWAALEAIALFGLFLFLVGWPLGWMIPFVAASFLLILTRPPNLGGILDRARRLARH